MENRFCLYIGLWIISGCLFSGCAAVKTFPQVARGGDTITLAVGSPDNMNRQNTNVSFVSDVDASIVNIPIRSIFKLYADKVSSVYQVGLTNTNSIIDYSGHEPWVNIIALDLPPGLTPGTGVLNISTTAIYPAGLDINGYPISIEILPGTGTPSVFEYYRLGGTQANGDLSLLEPLQHVKVRPAFGDKGSWPAYAAMEIKLNTPTTAGTALVKPLVRVELEDMEVSTFSDIISYWWITNGEDITVHLISPNGLLKYYEARMAVVLSPQFAFSGTPVISSVNYYDANGNAVPGPAVNSYNVTIE